MIEGTWFNTDKRYSEPDKFRQNAMNLRVQLYNVKKEICLYSSHKVFENWLIQCIMIHMGRHDIMGLAIKMIDRHIVTSLTLMMTCNIIKTLSAL